MLVLAAPLLLTVTLSGLSIRQSHATHAPVTRHPSSSACSLRNHPTETTAYAEPTPADGKEEVRKGRATRWMETTVNGISTWALMTIDQYPTVTTQWIETTLDGVSTWTSYVYTQTFPEAPGEWHGPRSGAIGLGDPTHGVLQPNQVMNTGTPAALIVLAYVTLTCLACLGTLAVILAW